MECFYLLVTALVILILVKLLLSIGKLSKPAEEKLQKVNNDAANLKEKEKVSVLVCAKCGNVNHKDNIFCDTCGNEFPKQ